MHSRRPPRHLRTTVPTIPLLPDVAAEGSGILGEPVLADGCGGGARELPVLPVRNTVLLPNTVVHLFIDREPAMRAVEDAVARGRTLLIVAQRDAEIMEPLPQDVYTIGTECAVNRVLRMPDGSSTVFVQGLRRFRIDAWVHQSPFGRVRGVAFDEPVTRSDQAEALQRTAIALFENCVKHSQKLTEDAYIQALNIGSVGALADYLISQLEPPVAVRQEVLESLDPCARLRKVIALVRRELHILELEQRITGEVQQEMERGQREYYLREQLRVIQRELGEHDPATRETQELREQVQARGLPEAVRARALKEIERLEAMPPLTPESAIVRSYVDWLLALPWTEATRDQIDLRQVAAVLDTHHYGLERVKDRILEFLAVRKLCPEGRAPILCLVGPPGVGKTSLGRSIAEAMGRQFVRVALGGVRDEAEIRGHRRTYVGALPGRILQAMKTAGTTNPVFVLDEVDKLASDYRGDPAAALLEVLDPEQNAEFSDHYLEVPYDLSQVFFLLTANVLDTIPAPLRDRMEVIEISGYTEEEKVHIAQSFLLPRAMRETGLNEQRVEIDELALRRMIREYTFEAGVRGLDREINAVLRRVARRVAEGRRAKAVVSAQRVPNYLGAQKYYPTEAEASDQIGVATGLAWTAGGGDLTTVEVMAVPGRGNILLTGQLGDVMKESAQAALTFTRARAEHLGLSPTFHENSDIHIHLPAASIPKDGPSAGITMATAVISALTGRAVRRDVALTGEISLRGRVLPVGGIKEKVLAAHRAGLSMVVLPRRNLKDLDEVPAEVRQAITFEPVDAMDEVLRLALVPAYPQAGGEVKAPLPGRMAVGSSKAPLPLPEPHAPNERVARPRARREQVLHQ